MARIAVLLFGLVSLALGCASAPRPGTGDVSFRLLWEGGADLDLIVEDPTGATISFFTRAVESGGQLDIDCNAEVDNLCPRPIENVFWPRGFAPAGRYRATVRYFNPPPDGSTDPVAYTLLILRGEEIVERHSGALAEPEDASPEVVHDYAPAPEPAGIRSARRDR